MKKTLTASCVALLAIASAASANIRITEYMYSGGGAEYVELTNVGAAPIDMTGWSYDDSSGTAGSVDLSAFGIVAAGESVVFTEADAAQFTADWSLAGVKVIGGVTDNLGRADTINVYNASSLLADSLDYGDQAYPGTVRTQAFSGWTNVSGPGPFGVIDGTWVLSSVGDAQSSTISLNGDVGSPGIYRVVPEPTTLGLVGGLGLIAFRRR